jgi:hypothetical protein
VNVGRNLSGAACFSLPSEPTAAGTTRLRAALDARRQVLFERALIARRQRAVDEVGERS